MKDPSARTVRATIKRLVKLIGSKTGLARRLSVSPQAVDHWLGPRQSLPRPETRVRLRRLAERLERKRSAAKEVSCG